MIFLVTDTSGSTGGVLLAETQGTAGGVKVLGVRALATREFSTQLIPAISKLLNHTNRNLAGIDAFAIIRGPGSFTGLRIGLSAIKALAEVTGVPIIALSRLAVMASKASRHLQSSENPVHVAMAAGRSELYHGVYADAGRACIAESLETLDSLRASLRSLPGPIVVSDPAAAALLQAAGGIDPVELDELGVEDALPLVLTAWTRQDFRDPALLDASYLRGVTPRTISQQGANLPAAVLPASGP